eukprot:529115_1
MSYSFSICYDDCDSTVIDAVEDNDFDALCAMDYSCLEPCGVIYDSLAANCECDTGELLESSSFSFSYSGVPVLYEPSTYCCGDDDCQSDILNLIVSFTGGSMSYSYGFYETYFDSLCTDDISCPSSKKKSDDDDSQVGLAIGLGVAGGVVVLAAAGFGIYKYQNKA